MRLAVIVRNPTCQAIDLDGNQCQAPATEVHHLVDPKDDPGLFFDWKNVVAVCARHHAGGQRGETQGRKYVPTNGLDVSF